VARLLDSLVASPVTRGQGQRRVKCIFIYGSLQAYGEVPALAQARNISVIMNIWLEGTPAANTAQVG
jgi:phage tail sheath gpL-like